MSPHLAIDQEVVRVCEQDVEPKKLERMVGKHPDIAIEIATAYEKLVVELEQDFGHWAVIGTLTHKYSEKAQTLRSMLARLKTREVMAKLLRRK